MTESARLTAAAGTAVPETLIMKGAGPPARGHNIGVQRVLHCFDTIAFTKPAHMCRRFRPLGILASDGLEGSRHTGGGPMLVNPEKGKCSLTIRFAYPEI